MQDILEQWADTVRAAGARGSALRLRGGGSKDWYGETPQGELLDTRPYAGIVDYEPTELVITARCGTPLAEVESVLAGQGQMLAFEPPHFGPGATVGGTVASGLAGPRRAYAGSVRDFVLGAGLLDGRGDLLRFGGQVMKNVAGYDVSRLLAGSLGTLGVIVDVSLKVLPRPVRETTLQFELGQGAALQLLNRWAGEPLPLSASCWHRDVLTIRLSGADAAVAAARKQLGGAELAAPEPYWRALREHEHAYFRQATALWRLSLPSAAPPLALPGEQLVEWGGAQRWLAAGGDPGAAAIIRKAAAGAGGHATLFHAPRKDSPVFHPLSAPVARINQRITRAFDPNAIFNPGRLYRHANQSR